MDDEQKRRLLGLRKLIHEGVKVGADYVQAQHHRAMETPYRVLETIPGVAGPTQVVERIHRGITDLSYDGIRLVNELIDQVGDAALKELGVTPPPPPSTTKATTAPTEKPADTAQRQPHDFED